MGTAGWKEVSRESVLVCTTQHAVQLRQQRWAAKAMQDRQEGLEDAAVACMSLPGSRAQHLCLCDTA